jgi:Leucine-rich repeat (LRR) protein
MVSTFSTSLFPFSFSFFNSIHFYRPDELGGLAADLRHLTLTDNRLAELPMVLAQLTRLETLDVSGNRLTSVTSFPFEDMVQLRVLKLARNQLRTLPARIGALEQLRELDVSENEIESLPPDLADALALEELRCVNNQLKEVPTAWRRMKAVKVLRLDKNQLVKFPGEILRDTPVVVVSITDNPMREEDFYRLEGYEEVS